MCYQGYWLKVHTGFRVLSYFKWKYALIRFSNPRFVFWWKVHVSVGKMCIKSRAELGISILNIGVFDITSKVQVHFNCYHTHDLAFLNVYSQRISTWNIGYVSKYRHLVFSRMVPDEMGSVIFMFQSNIAVINKINFL